MADLHAFRPVVLLIIDGFGWRDTTADNAVRLATTPHYDALWGHGPRGFLRASDPRMGLAAGEASDCALGHRTIGAGRLVAIETPLEADTLLGGVIGRAGCTQLRLAGPQKFEHVTSSINAGSHALAIGETHLAVVDVATAATKAIGRGTYDFILINLGDADAAGHTGDLALAIRAVERVDAAIGRISEAVRTAGGAMLVTSDHGNCEQMRDATTGWRHAGNTANDVPVILMAPGAYLFRDGTLADVAPTILTLMGLSPPPVMTGRALQRRILVPEQA